MADLISQLSTYDTTSPFHRGEQFVQKKLGVRAVEDWARKVIRDYLPDQHQDFYEALPYLIVSTRDAAGRPWATLLEGEPGFITSPDKKKLEIEGGPVKGDALSGALQAGADIGILGIEFASRRRNRVNGRVSAASRQKLTFDVGQSFGNCPQYIRVRECHVMPEEPVYSVYKGNSLTPSQEDWIRSADTFFIASGYQGTSDSPANGMDVSHRGGVKGFVTVSDKTRLVFPDYAGNNHYNTLGNLILDPRAGLLFLDFSTGSMLQLTGLAHVDWDSEHVAKYPGAKQLVIFEVVETVELAGVLRSRWREDSETSHSLELVNKTIESADVVSLEFAARDGAELRPFLPGQHLPLSFSIPGFATRVQRSYSISNAPGNDRYRIAVKRKKGGLVSNFLHDVLDVGGTVLAGNPSGGFALGAKEDPLVLISAGIGVTPMLSILHHAAKQTPERAIWFVQGVRNGAHHPFRDEVRDAIDASNSFRSLVYYSQPFDSDVPREAFDRRGRISGREIAALSGSQKARFLICGPAAFTADVKESLEASGVLEEQIAFETF